jgi:hypothetical protein
MSVEQAIAEREAVGPAPSRSSRWSFATRDLSRLRQWVPIVGFACVVAWASVSVHFQGHNWGDDFAQYVNQARGLANGTVAQVVTDTRYTVDNSASATFGPYVSPWGLPILLAPLYVLFGLNYTAFKMVGVLCFGLFVVAFHRLVVWRMSTWRAWALTILLGLSPPYLLWSDSVTADLPALGFVFLTLLWLDRCRRLDRFGGLVRKDLVIVGLLIGWAFSVRRETVALLASLVVAQLLFVRARRNEREPDGSRPPIPWRALATPWCAAFGLLAVLQLVLPSSLVLDTANGGWSQLKPNAIWYRNIVGDHIGLHRGGRPTLDLLSSRTLGVALFTAFVVLAVVGAVVQTARRPNQDAPLLAYLLGVMLIVGRQAFHEGRYMFTIVPLLAYFAAQALPAVGAGIDRLARRRTQQSSSPRLLTTAQAMSGATLLFLTPLVQSNWTTLSNAISYHREYDYIQEGPEGPQAKDMFEAVRRCTRGDNVVLFFRARAMNLYTGRRTIQTGGINEAITRADWMVLDNSDVNYSEPPIDKKVASRLGLARVWRNERFSLFMVHPSRSTGVGPCASGR